MDHLVESTNFSSEFCDSYLMLYNDRDFRFHLWFGSAASVTCPSAMTDGAARLLSRHLSTDSLSSESRSIYQSAYDRLISRDPRYAWTSGQWMTERQGGSDVSRTETIATSAAAPLDSKSVDGFPLGPWSISGFKWFSSATDANMAILLARTPDDKISTFFAPMRRTVPGENETELNGVSIQRLKVKYGTKSLPTAELELKDMRGYLLGSQGYGIREVATILNITRVHTAIGTMGGWGRGLAISRAFARVRVVGGKKLMDIPAHVKVMAQQEVEYRGYMHLTFFSVLLLGISEQTATSATAALDTEEHLRRIMPDQKDAILLLRILTPVVKATTAKAGIAGLSECMESLGGVGYLENEEMEFNVARLLRDTAVGAIWEGTTDVLASDLLKVLKGRQGRETMMVLERWLGNAGSDQAGLAERFAAWKGRLEFGDLEMLKVYGRDVMFELGRIISGCLLKLDADLGGCPLASEIHRRWVNGRPGLTDTIKYRQSVEMDRRIVFEGRIQSISAAKL